MQKLIIFLAVILIPAVSFGQIANPSTLTTNERTDFVLSTIAFGSVGATFTSFLANASSFPIRDLDILNLTDQPITCSYNGTNDHVVVPAYSSYSPQLAEIQLHHATALSCKRTDSAPTVGSVYVSAGY